MEELIGILTDIKNALDEMNSNITKLNDNVIDIKYSVDEIKGDGFPNSITDVYAKLNDIAGDIFSLTLKD